MHNRNFISPVRLFVSSVVLFLIAQTGTLYAGNVIVELYHIKTKENKSIIVLGMEHYSDNFEEMNSMVKLIEDQDQCAKSIAFLMERPLDNERTSFNLSFSNYLEIKNSFEKTVLKNIEIRTVSTAVLTLLNPHTDLNYVSTDSFFQNGGSSPVIKVNSITFQQVYDEYDYHKKTLSEEYNKYDDLHIQDLFKQTVDKVEEDYKRLQFLFNKFKYKYGVKEDEAIVTLIKKIKAVEKLRLEKKLNGNKKGISLSRKFMKHIFNVFIPLFDMNAFNQTIQQKMSSDIILLTVGYLHARTMKNWLMSCDETLAQSIINDKSFGSHVANDFHVPNTDIICKLADILKVENPVLIM